MTALLIPSSFPAQRHFLPSGLTVIHQQITTAPVVVVDVWARAGAAAEPAAWAGMAHFLEHMIFKGSDRLPPGAFDALIENRGGVTNAATSHDYAHYFIHTTPRDLSVTLPALAELLLNAAIPDEEFDRERLVVLEELRQTDDDPDSVIYQAQMESVFPNHAYGRSVLGSPDTLMAMSPAAMRQFHQTYYQPENLTIAIVGDVDRETALELVNRAFGNFAPAQSCPISDRGTIQPCAAQRQILQLPRLEQARLLMTWTAPGVAQLETAYGLDLLSMVLAGGQSSRLVWQLREEEQLVQAIGSSFSLQRDASVITVSAWLEPEDIEQVEARICARLQALATTAIDAIELQRHQRLLRNDYAFSTETASQIAGLYGYYNTIAQAEVAVTYPQTISQFEPDELQQLAADYLRPDQAAVAIALPAN
ncbi:insulinase family protein [Microcoleus sp. FACHB-1515]|uniref:M16 family metallopeptidase n=1 Tax=Cyanophyceae TaxID=3028117 RepID=UPI001689C2E3|nr:pitrilysin family protein [Microcoleus sp. FACHB-1515]MBD2092635.1 insulinase family protein [Microcoleus sp. FACHB-1515]